MTADELAAQILALIEGGLPTESAPDPTFFIDWHELFASDPGDEEWLAWPVIPAHRQCVVYAPPKAGKSLLVLDIVAAIASGRPVLGQPNTAGKRHVLYLDYEMTAADLLERLIEMGYEPEELDHLHYALLPIMPALNTQEGAKIVRQKATECGAELVVIDTLSRAVDGDIYHPDTINEFYRWTGIALKADGRALCRLDHEGKDPTKGQLGSIMKAADVDVVWKLSKTDNGLKLRRTYTRIMWGQDEVDVEVKRDPLRHVIGLRADASGTSQAVKELDELGVPSDASVRVARQALKQAGTKMNSAALQDACRKRRERNDLEGLAGASHQVYRDVRVQSDSGSNGSPGDTPLNNPSDQGGTPGGTLRYAKLGAVPDRPPYIGRYGTPGPLQDPKPAWPADDDDF